MVYVAENIVIVVEESNMPPKPGKFDPYQRMRSSEFELQYKRDEDLAKVGLHHHDFFEIFYLISGNVTYTIEGRLYRVLPGDLLLISPMELHQVTIQPDEGGYERFVLWVSEECVRRLGAGKADLTRALDPAEDGYVNQLRLGSGAEDIRLLLTELYTESHSDRFGSSLLCDGLLTRLLISINRFESETTSDARRKGQQSDIVAAVIEYIGDHYAESLSLDDLAERFYISKYHLSHEFSRQTGSGVYRYIQKKRLLIARARMAQGEKPTEVSTACGFRDYGGFYRAFRAEYGISPREFVNSLR